MQFSPKFWTWQHPWWHDQSTTTTMPICYFYFSNTATNIDKSQPSGNIVKPSSCTQKWPYTPHQLHTYCVGQHKRWTIHQYHIVLLTSYRKQHKLLHFSHEGFRPQHNTTRQIQMIVRALEDAQLTNKNIYLTYIDFRDAFGSIDHAMLYACEHKIALTFV